MFYNLLGFCSRKYQYKALIYSCYADYKACYNNVKNNSITGTVPIEMEEWGKLSQETKTYMAQNSRKQAKIVEEMVAILKIYCKEYPTEDVCKHCNFKTYDEYPYRFPQTLPYVMRIL